MNLGQFYEIENYFERGIYSHADSVVDYYLKALEQMTLGNFNEFYQRIDDRLIVSDHTEKGIGLIWTILVAETQYNLNKRQSALAEFHLLADQRYNELFEFYRMLFKAVGYAFESLQIEALASYTRSLMLAEIFNYQRGSVRALAGTGLIHKELGNQKESQTAFKKALEIAQTGGFLRATKRLMTLQTQTETFMQLILENDFSYARKKIIQAEVDRRQQGVHRKVHSFYVWLAVVDGLEGKKQKCERVLTRLNDRVLKIQALKLLKAKSFELSPQLLASMKIIGAEFYEQGKSETIHLDEIKNINVRALVQILSASALPLNKTALFEKVYGFPYDPVIHDAKLYKLIMMTRKEVGPDVVINHHGAYSFNRKFQFNS